MIHQMSSHELKDVALDSGARPALAEDYERFGPELPRPLEAYVRERYRLDLSSEYAGIEVKNPLGKGSGQLSLNVSQVGRDAREGLGFVVLKTIIAEDADGGQSMSDWAIPETRMAVEPIVGTDGTPGWTVTWKGRGWYDTFEKYLEFFGEALDEGRAAGMLVVPSCKYHLPRPGEGAWRLGEYEYTTRRLLDVWESRRGGSTPAMPLEKDFSPTLAGSDRAAHAERIVEWLVRVAGHIRRGAAPRRASIGLKLFNAVFDDDFQLETLRAVGERCGSDDAPDFVIYANRLFDSKREFDGVRGVAYGGPDLSARNLAVLGRLRALERAGAIPPFRLPLSATGDIASGRTAAEYLLRGASTFQMHTLFQLPASEFDGRSGKTARAIHRLLFHPDDGLIAWLLHLRRANDWPESWNVKRMADAAVDRAVPVRRERPAASAPGVGAVEIRPLSERDIPDAMRLKRIAHWNQTETDWRRLLRLEPRGCFAAVVDGRLVATTTAIRYGTDLAWIGMVLVDPASRRRGIATRLVRTALDFLEREGVAAAMLDATPAGRPVYEALGFEAEAIVERWAGVARRAERKANGVAVARDGTLADVCALDRHAFEADRSALLGALAEGAHATPLVARGDGGAVVGYAFARRGADAAYAGPVVAPDAASAAALVDALFAELDGQRVYVDVDTRFAGATALLEERGFHKQRELVRMRRGRARPGATAPMVFAIAGPEVG